MLKQWFKEAPIIEEQTRNHYRSSLKKFMDYVFEDTGSLHINLRDVKKEQRETKRQEKHEVLDNFLRQYINSTNREEFLRDIKGFAVQIKQDLAITTARGYFSGVKTFFEETQGWKITEKEMRKIRRRIFKKVKSETKDRIPTREELRKILNQLDPLARSFVLFLCSSGCRVGEAIQLEIQDIDLKGEKYGVPHAWIRKEVTKTEEGRIVFFSTEASEAIKVWLKGRKGKKKRTKNTNKKEGDIYHESEKVWNVTDQRIRQTWYKALKETELDEKDPSTGRYKLHLHSLRKYFNTKIQLSKQIRHALLGHSGDLEAVYTAFTKQELAEKYKDHMNDVAVFVEEDIQEWVDKRVEKQARKTRLDTVISILKAEGIDEQTIERIKSKHKAIASTDSDQVLTLEEDDKHQPQLGEKIDIGLMDFSKKEFTNLIDDLMELIEDQQTQKVVSEDELEQYLNKGWRYVDTNDQGVIIEK